MSAPESPLGRIYQGQRTNGISGPSLVWGRKYSDEEVLAGRKRNQSARGLVLQYFLANQERMSDEVEMAFFDAIQLIWIDASALTDGGRPSAKRREEDGIPSPQAMLAWFADNERLSEPVRAAARKRLDSLLPLEGKEPGSEP